MKYMKSGNMSRPASDRTFTYVDRNVLMDKELTPEDRLVYVLLCSNVKQDGENVITISVKNIVDSLQILEPVVHDSIAHLENRGVIKSISYNDSAYELEIVGNDALCYM